MKITRDKINSFQHIVWAHYRAFGRHKLPWRHTRNPYRILVSEVMLQQTYVERVLPYYKKFLKAFPTAQDLARASLAEVLLVWQGLGYNRRAKMLLEAGKIMAKCGVPETETEFVALPGVGVYSARAVMCFTYDTPAVLIETNIRTAILHYFFSKKMKLAGHSGVGDTTIYGSIPDAEVAEVLTQVTPKGKAREWNWALMDYGAYLKKTGVRINARSASYSKQSPFKGSLREARGAILKVLSKSPQTRARLRALFSPERYSQIDDALVALQKENLIEKCGRAYALPHF